MRIPMLSCILVAACSSSYQPAQSPRVAVVMDSGYPAYVRDGHTYPGGILGGDLMEAVHGSPEAESYARTFRNQMITGFTLDLVGIASEVGGLAVVTSSYSNSDNTKRNVGWGLTLSGLATVLVGTVFIVSAQPHLFDAVNAYNDSVDRNVQGFPRGDRAIRNPSTVGTFDKTSAQPVLPHQSPPTISEPEPSLGR